MKSTKETQYGKSGRSGSSYLSSAITEGTNDTEHKLRQQLKKLEETNLQLTKVIKQSEQKINEIIS